MKLVTKTAAAVLALSCCFAGLGTTTANAMTFLDFIRGGPGSGGGQSTKIISPDFPPPPSAAKDAGAGAAVTKVDAPQYYTYKPEAMRLVAANRFADPIVTGAVADASATPVSPGDFVPQRRYLTEAKVMATNDVAKMLRPYY